MDFTKVSFSKSIHYIYQRLAWTCCKYHANPKISIHKQPQLYVAKVRFSAENNERKTIKISMLNDSLKQHRGSFLSLCSTCISSFFTFDDKGMECVLQRIFFQIRFYSSLLNGKRTFFCIFVNDIGHCTRITTRKSCRYTITDL